MAAFSGFKRQAEKASLVSVLISSGGFVFVGTKGLMMLRLSIITKANILGAERSRKLR